MIRQIIRIDEEKCNGCSLCANACHEGAIDMVDGKAKLVREHFCDGFGDCLPACPTGAISFEEREAPAYDEEAVKKAQEANKKGCPGVQVQSLKTVEVPLVSGGISRLQNWPPQIKLAPMAAPYFDMADVLIAADCAGFAYGAFHEDFMKGKVTLIGCPKLDGIDYSQKLSAIFTNNNIQSITVVKMEVPCCGGLSNAVRKAIEISGKDISLSEVTISIDGRVLEKK
ncbi:MAG: 4Fe-4S binding protein [Bacillota bacterium]|nr:4Fe-4S binding protein [Bacillota bacterium]